MLRHKLLIVVAAATLTSAALIVPTSGVAAHGWTTVNHNDYPIVEGSGRVVQQARSVGDFRRVETWGAEQVEVRLGARPSLVIAADDNILPLLSSEVKNGALQIKSKGSYRIRGPIRVWITTPDLDAISTWGSGDVDVSGVNNGRFEMTSYGSGELRATGRTGKLDVDVYGSGSAKLASLDARDVQAAVYGSGSALVRASGELNARVMGSGSVRYVGRPAALRQSRFGSGSIVGN